MRWFNRNKTTPAQAQQAAPPAPKGPGLATRAGRFAQRAGRAYLDNRKEIAQAKAAGSKPGEQQDDILQQGKKDGATVGAAFKNGLIVAAAILVPLGCAFVAFLAAGYYFNGGREYTGDTESLISYGLAGLVEFGLLALLTASALAFWNGKAWHFLAALIFALPLVYVSTSAQLLYLSTHIDLSAARQAAQTLGAVPFVGYFLGGANGGAFILIARSCVTSVLEVAACYVLARATINTKKIIAARREKAHARLELARYDRLARLEQKLDNFAMHHIDRLEAMLDAEQGQGQLVPFRANGSRPAGNGKKATAQP